MSIRSSLCLMATMVREKFLSPVELVREHLDQIQRVNPKINAFVSVFAEEALAAAKRAEYAVMHEESLGLLHGVPVTVKDSFDMAGHATLCGSKLRLGHRAVEDSTAVARLRDEGAIILGRTNTAEQLFNYESDNYITGRTNNPWALDRTAGGSSGGESAAIAAFCSAGGIGSDGGGSIRVPAHFTGIAGLKPTPGRVSAAGHFPPIAHPGGLLGVAGPMARTARDVQLLFASLAGWDSQDPFSAPVPLRPAEIDGLRIGVMETLPGFAAHPAIRDAVLEASRFCGGAEEFTPPFSMERANEVWWFFFGRVNAPGIAAAIGDRRADVHWTLTELLDQAQTEPPITAEELLAQLAARDRMRCALLRAMETHRVLLLPACGVPAFRHGEREWTVGGERLTHRGAMAPSSVFNMLGLPGLVIPFGMTEDGLPVGVQLVGQPWDEELLLELGARLEEERGIFGSPELS